MKDIHGYEGRYAATEDGAIWSYPKIWDGGGRSHEGQFLKPYRTGNLGKQYLSVDLDGKRRPVHVLVAEAYLANPLALPEVNHLDGVRFHNNVSNLEWCTHRRNMDHAQATGLNKQFYGEQHGRHKLSSEQVEEIRSKKEWGWTLKELAEEYGSSISNISYIVRWETRVHG